MRPVLHWFAEPSSAFRAGLMRRTVSLFALVLFAATFRLWIPQDRFPQVPLIAPAGSIPPALEWFLGATILVTLVASLIAKRQRLWRTALLAFAVAVGVLMSIDQHRLQPWAYQFVIIALVFAWADRARALALLRLLTVSIYFHSALSKLDYTFAHSLGRRFVDVLLAWFGGSIAAWPEEVQTSLALLLPAGELLVAVLLCLRGRPRLAGIALAIGMHLALLLILGPGGLNHRPAVLIWNLFFIAQVLVLFQPWTRIGPARQEPRPPGVETPRAGAASPVPDEDSGSWSDRAAEGFVLLVVLLPLLEPLDRFDPWPAWGLYATRGSRVVVLLPEAKVDRLPPRLRPLVEPGGRPGYVHLRIDRWSLEGLAVPLYPQARFQLGVAQAVAKNFDLADSLVAVHLSAANRWTGKRASTVLTGLRQIEAAGDRFLFNAHRRGGAD